MENNQNFAGNNQQYGQGNQPQEFCPDTNLVWAILCTILCCLPFGIVAIIKATSVENLWRQGRYEEARRASKSALNFSIWGAVISAVFCFIYVIFWVFVGFASVALY